MHRETPRILTRIAISVAVLGMALGSIAPPGASADSANPTFPPPSARPAELGVVYQGTWNFLSTTQRAQVLDDLAAAGVGWVTMDLGWKSLQPNGPDSYSMGDVAEWDKQIREVRARGLKIMAIFQIAPPWASGTSNRNGRPRDPNEYAEAAAWVAKRYDGSVSPSLKIEAMQLWNEPDRSYYWASEPAATRVSSLARLTKAAGTAVKRANPNMKVIAGAVSSIDVSWVTEFYREPGIIGTYDAIAVHPYHSPGDATPEAYDPKWGQYYMRHLAVLDELMSTRRDPARIWATEFGWSSHPNSSSTPGWARGVTEAQQADYLLRAMPVLASTPRLQAAFWYAAVTTSSGDVQFDNYGLLRRDLGRKPAYYALKCAAANDCGPTSGGPTNATLIAAGSSWSYEDSDADLGTSWRSDTYNYSSWARGAAQLGFGDGDEKTILRSGTPSNRPATTYFRTTFEAGSNVSQVQGLRLRALVDDGAAVYLNGTEIWRNNLPSGSLTHKTRSVRYVAGEAEKQWVSVDLPRTALRTGTNRLAVEVHQHAPNSSDLSFDLSLQSR